MITSVMKFWENADAERDAWSLPAFFLFGMVSVDMRPQNGQDPQQRSPQLRAMGTEEGFHLACCQASAPQQDVRPGSLLPHGDLPCGGNAHGDLRSHGRHTAGIDTHGADAQATIPMAAIPKAAAPKATAPRANIPAAKRPRLTRPTLMSPMATTPTAAFPMAMIPLATSSRESRWCRENPIRTETSGIPRTGPCCHRHRPFPGRTGSDRLPSPPNGVPGFDPSPAPG